MYPVRRDTAQHSTAQCKSITTWREAAYPCASLRLFTSGADCRVPSRVLEDAHILLAVYPLLWLGAVAVPLKGMTRTNENGQCSRTKTAMPVTYMAMTGTHLAESRCRGT